MDPVAIDANAARYLNGIGLVMLLYDHVLSFDDEVRLVWQAKPSFAKKAFLLNKYLVPVVLLGWANLMNSFSSDGLADSTCRQFFVFSSLVGIISIGIANVLILLRVISLWDRKRSIAILLGSGFLVSFCATFGLMVAVTAKVSPGVAYNPQAHMCTLTTETKILPAVWASPMLFEILVLIFVCWNAFDRPRSRDTPLTRSLARDGMGFFAALTIFRTFNLVLTIVRPDLIELGVFFVWAMTTLVLNRSMLNIHRAADETNVETHARIMMHCYVPLSRTRSSLAVADTKQIFV
ncbi:hypothetical protein M0805_009863 [Coniferiporia weirii]|nr:hypothetical protein M0805_009863 [Coniferiporia weirii]